MARLAVAVLLVSTIAACSSPAGGPTQLSPTAAVRHIQLNGKGPLAIAVAGGSLWIANYDSGTVTRVDPDTAPEETTIKAGPNPAFLLAVGDRIWVESYGSPKDARLSWIETPSGRVDDGSHASQLCCNLATDGQDIWAIDPSGAVVRFDGSTGRVLDRFPVTIDRNFHSNLVYASGAVWVASDNADLQRVDPGSGDITTVATGGGVPFEVDGEEIWGASSGEIWVVDARTATVARRVPIPNSMEVLWLALDDSAIWLAIRHPGYIGAVLRMDRDTGRVTQEIPAGIPSFIVSAFGAAWVVDYDTNELVKIPA